MKQYLLSIERVDKIDLPKTVAAARAGTLDVLEKALRDPNANKNDVYQAMAPLGQKLEGVVRGFYLPGTEIGSEERGIQGDVATATVLFVRPGLVEKLATFFARTDVKALDFSEAAAPAGEKAIAAFRDEICGGGGFSNPASSISRRAIATDATADDLRFFVRCAVFLDLDYSWKTSAELLIDPQSAIRRPLDATLARLPPNIPPEHKELAARGIAHATASGDGRLRDIGGVREAVERVCENLRELREVSGNNAATFAAGKDLLLALETRRRVAPGFIAHMVNAVRTVDIDPIARLNPRSSSADIHSAVSAMNTAGENILLAASGAKALLDGMDESMACRKTIRRVPHDTERRNSLSVKKFRFQDPAGWSQSKRN